MLHVPFDLAKELLVPGRLPDSCAAKNLLEDTVPNAADPKYMEEVVRASLGTLYGAGTDTIVSTFQSFFIVIVLYPEVQAKAQQTIDLVCYGRLPDFSDFHALPYVHALLKEVMGWNPVIPLNLAHVSTTDDVYNGYHIPKGTFVLANTWAILHDPDVYPNPEIFNPECFLRTGSAGGIELNPGVRDPDVATFGFGRRTCPGRHLAYDALRLAIASVLATRTISRAKGADGREIVPKLENAYGFVMYVLWALCLGSV